MKKITPVLLGADLNCYSVARAFHEAYGVVSYAFGKYAIGETEHSRIVKFCKTADLGNDKVMLDVLLDFAKNHTDEELYLFGCTDEYQEMMIRNQEKLKKYYFFSCPKREIAEKLISKEAFYGMCEKYDIPYPKTSIFKFGDSFDKLLESNLGFEYPIILKPSSSIEYWRNPFDGMKKVYLANDAIEAEKIIFDIYSSGYGDSVILQEYISGNEDNMFVVTAYSDKNSAVKMVCMGRVLLGEHTPKGIGNHVAIITEYHKDMIGRLSNFLDSIGYCGFSNFDIKFDERDNSFKVFEINLRQGRSNYYVTASGNNIADLVVNDRHSSFGDSKKICCKEFFWHTVPKKIIYKYISNDDIRKKVQGLVSSKQTSSTLFYSHDIRFNFMRSCFVFIHNIRYFRKYKIYK